ncbi:MAG: hypothetical protein UR94_C0017G0007 [Parcubacteria group bacterium GW2011_GWA2_36_10]|nr:MAG: hypothetical protein UR94_C0017G0007 [Parcubacteria group bacterium GW2011_GWA2_36_10]
MKYLALLIFFILTHTVYSLVDLGSWSLLEPFLIMLILVYYIFENPWIYYPLALGAGLLVDGFSASFGLHTFSFLLVLFSLSTLQLTIFTSKNTGTIIFLTWLGCIIFWLSLWLLYYLSHWSIYILSWPTIWQIIKMIFIDTGIIVFVYILYFNLWLKKHHEKRSF